MSAARLKHLTRIGFSPPETGLQLLVLGVLFVAALCVRLYGIGDPPMDFAAVRQYHGALLARGIYQWLLTGDLRTLPPDGILEPPILEGIAALAYLTIGEELLWVPRLASTLFWIVGGTFLYLIARKVVSPNAAILSVVFYLFAPGVVLLSRAFMPEPLMIMLLLASILTILRYHERPSTRRLLVAAAVSSLALFVKPGICFFQIFAVFFALSIYTKGLLRSVTSLYSLLFVVLSILPTALYYSYGTIIGDFLQAEADDRIVPELIFRSGFWTSWLFQIRLMVGYVAFLGALLGLLCSLRRGLSGALMVGLWGGYLLFGLVFTFHIHTHDYYSLQFVPVVALSLGCMWNVAVDYLRRAGWRNYGRGIVFGLFFLALVLSVLEYRTTISAIAYRGHEAKAFPGDYVGHMLIADYESRARTYREVGKIVDHSRRTIFLAPDYGYPLLYHGRISGDILFPNPATVTNDFRTLRKENSPKYFIVFKRFSHYDMMVDWSGTLGDQPDARIIDQYRSLRKLVTKKNFPVVAESADYMIFDLQR